MRFPRWITASNSHVHELNFEGAKIARQVADEYEAAHPGEHRLVAGSMGPTNRTASMSQDVNSPASRGVTFDKLREVYHEQARGLVEGGADLLLVETVFDTLNAKAALFAIDEYFQSSGQRVPIMLSVTIVDQSGRTLSGQTVEAFWISVSHMELLSVGINCALGAKQMRPYVEELSHLAPVHISCHPNAGLPNAFGGFDETPERMAADLRDFSSNGWLNIAGGCCGSTPAHIRAIADAVRGLAPHVLSKPERYTRFSGLEPLVLRPGLAFRQHRRTHQRHRFAEIFQADSRRRVRSGAGRGPPAGRKRRADHRHQHGRSHARFRARHDHVSAPHRRRARHRPRADHDRQLELEGDRSRA